MQRPGVRREPRGVGREKGERGFCVVAVFGEIEVHPADQVPGRIARFQKILERAFGLGEFRTKRCVEFFPQRVQHPGVQISDGTLRLIVLLWALQERAGPLLLEEPEFSLHGAIVRRLGPFIHRAQRAGNGRQVILSTHSDELLMDPGIAPEELLMVHPADEGSEVLVGASIKEVSRLMKAGIPASEALMPRTAASQLELFNSALA